jgi:hypothetical protein
LKVIEAWLQSQPLSLQIMIIITGKSHSRRLTLQACPNFSCECLRSLKMMSRDPPAKSLICEKSVVASRGFRFFSENGH